MTLEQNIDTGGTKECMSIKRTISNLKSRNIDAQYFISQDELSAKIKGYLKDDIVVSTSGSQTLFDLGIIKQLREGNHLFLDRHIDLTKEERRKLYLESFNADIYFSSSNAITESGIIFNMDGTGNRVASLIYGPLKVIIVIGTNKIVKTEEDALARHKYVSGPLNAKRLGVNTPCVETGYCMECNSIEKICNVKVLINRQKEKDRISVFIVEGNYGF